MIKLILWIVFGLPVSLLMCPFFGVLFFFVKLDDFKDDFINEQIARRGL